MQHTVGEMTSRSATWSCLFGVKSNEVCGSSRAAEQEVKQALEQRSVEALDDVCQRKGNKCLSLPVSRSPRQRAIHFVAQVGNIELIWVILRRKPRHVNKRNQFGQVPLVIACSVGHPRAVEVLLEAGADPSAFDWCQGMSPIHHSAMSGNAECLETLLGKHSAGGSERPIGDVVYKGFSSREGLLESRNAAGLTPLMIASKRANARAVQVLLNYGACPLVRTGVPAFCCSVHVLCGLFIIKQEGERCVCRRRARQCGSPATPLDVVARRCTLPLLVATCRRSGSSLCTLCGPVVASLRIFSRCSSTTIVGRQGARGPQLLFHSRICCVLCLLSVYTWESPCFFPFVAALWRNREVTGRPRR